MRDPHYDKLLSDFAYTKEHYFDHPAYLKINGKPVVFIYLTRVYFRDRGLEPLADLRKAMPDFYLAGDDVFGERHFTDQPDSKEGDVFRTMLRNIAVPLANPKANRTVLVTSFNEWYEDTQIEATEGEQPTATTTKDDSDSSNFSPKANGTLTAAHSISISSARPRMLRQKAVRPNSGIEISCCYQ